MKKKKRIKDLTLEEFNDICCKNRCGKGHFDCPLYDNYENTCSYLFETNQEREVEVDD